MSKNDLNSVQVRRPTSAWFDHTCDNKLTLSMGKLVPILVEEVIPGDQFNIVGESMLRMAPMIAPIMHNINVFTHYFFVPNRLVWDNWEKFITAANGQDPSQVPAPPMVNLEVRKAPNVNVTFPPPECSVWDYLGLPSASSLPPLAQRQSSFPSVSAIPKAAYDCIYREYYMDQNLTDPNAIYESQKLSDGIQGRLFQDADYNRTNIDVHSRAWQHDYFTASLPWAQKGQQVTLPIGSFDDVRVYRQDMNPATPSFAWSGTSGGAANAQVENLPRQNQPIDGALYADMQDLEINAATINDLRNAFRLQEWLEKMARGGSRYIEQILMHFGVRSSDARLQRPEFLGGMRNPMIISEVLQTSETQETPQGTMSGHGISAGSNRPIKYRCEEHGYIIGIMSIMPKTAYFQGVHRHWSRNSYLDYAWPTFAHIGEQAVLNKEIYVSGDGKNEEVFGYIPRYSEYRHKESEVHGRFRSTMDFWHMARKFDNRPNLNMDFINCNPTDRIFAVSEDLDDQHIWAHVFHRIKVKRNLPKYGTPTL